MNYYIEIPARYEDNCFIVKALQIKVTGEKISELKEKIEKDLENKTGSVIFVEIKVEGKNNKFYLVSKQVESLLRLVFKYEPLPKEQGLIAYPTWFEIDKYGKTEETKMAEAEK